jgi:hypothetical protein
MELTADNKTSHTTPFWEKQWCGVQRLHWGLQTVCPVQLNEIVEEQKSWQYTTVQEILLEMRGYWAGMQTQAEDSDTQDEEHM